MTNRYGIPLDPSSVRWAAAEGMPETVIAAVWLLRKRSVEESVAKLGAVELEQVIKLVGRSPASTRPGRSNKAILTPVKALSALSTKPQIRLYAQHVLTSDFPPSEARGRTPPEGSIELRNTHANLQNVRRTLARPPPGAAPVSAASSGLVAI